MAKLRGDTEAKLKLKKERAGNWLSAATIALVPPHKPGPMLLSTVPAAG